MPKKTKKQPIPVHPELIAFDLRIKQAEQRIQDSENEIAQIGQERDKAVVKLLNEKLGTTYESDDITEGYWECPTSPTAKCVYDEAEDGCHDNCLFCGDPEERK